MKSVPESAICNKIQVDDDSASDSTSFVSFITSLSLIKPAVAYIYMKKLTKHNPPPYWIIEISSNPLLSLRDLLGNQEFRAKMNHLPASLSLFC